MCSATVTYPRPSVYTHVLKRGSRGAPPGRPDVQPLTDAALNFRADGIHRPRPSAYFGYWVGRLQIVTRHCYGENVGTMTDRRSGIRRRHVLLQPSYAARYAGLSNSS